MNYDEAQLDYYSDWLADQDADRDEQEREAAEEERAMNYWAAN